MQLAGPANPFFDGFVPVHEGCGDRLWGEKKYFQIT
jgi:hypothetical protein